MRDPEEVMKIVEGPRVGVRTWVGGGTQAGTADGVVGVQVQGVPG